MIKSGGYPKEKSYDLLYDYILWFITCFNYQWWRSFFLFLIGSIFSFYSVLISKTIINLNINTEQNQYWLADYMFTNDHELVKHNFIHISNTIVGPCYRSTLKRTETKWTRIIVSGMFEPVWFASKMVILIRKVLALSFFFATSPYFLTTNDNGTNCKQNKNLPNIYLRLIYKHVAIFEPLSCIENVLSSFFPSGISTVLYF